MDDPDAAAATALPMTFGGRLPRSGEVVAAELTTQDFVDLAGRGNPGDVDISG